MFGRKNADEGQAPDLEICAVYDTKAKSYRDPIMGASVHDIVRSFTQLCVRSPDHEFVLHAEDFQLFKIGEYRKAKGELFTQLPEHVVNLHEVVRRQTGPQGIVAT